MSENQPPQPAGAEDEAAAAHEELARLLAEIEQGYIGPQREMNNAQERAAGRFLVANAFQHAFECWFPADPERPLFQKWLSTTKKLLGDNPDALYYGAIIDPRRTYRIRGNVHGACYTSFAVEAGACDGHLSKGVLATWNDDQFEVAADGSYDFLAGPDVPEGEGLRLAPEAGSITTRHYWEWDRSPAADPTFHVPLWIEPVENPGPAAPMDDAAVAAGIRRVINFVRGLTLDFPDLDLSLMPAWVSREVNRFDNSAYHESNAEIGFAAVDNAYLQTRYELGPDEVLLMRGRFPRCRFANVVLWNHRLQTPPYRYRRVSLNRRQTRVEADGSFTMAIAHRDPGLPNWLDAAGQRTGMIFWRFLLPGENVPPIEAEVVSLDDLLKAR
jgi:hypothetical protein